MRRDTATIKKINDNRSLNRIRREVQQQFLIVSRFVRRSGASIDSDRIFLFRFVARCRMRRGSTRKSCFLRLRGTRRKAGGVRSLTIDAASTRLMNESTGQRTVRDLEAYRCFRIFGFFSGLRYFVTSIVHCRGTLQVATWVLFPQNIEISGLYDTQIQFDRKWRSDFDLRSANTGLDICARCVDRSTLLWPWSDFFFFIP